MAQITTVALASRDVKQMVGGITPIVMQFDITNLSANVTNGDRIKIAKLPANAMVVGGAIRITGTPAITGLAQLQTMEPTGNAILLTSTLATSVAGSIMMSTPHSPITSTSGTRDLEIVLTSGSLSNSVAGAKVYVNAQYAFYP